MLDHIGIAVADIEGSRRFYAAALAPLAMGAHLLWQMTRLDIDDTDICLKLFRSNRDAGLIAALFLAVAAIV